MIGDTAHRPWPLPRRPWAMAMRWHDLLFMHWRVPVACLRGAIPSPLEIDTFDGTAWIGVVPFSMTAVRPRYVMPMPWLSAFPEINVRTYVVVDNKPGVWFFSLDAANAIAVRVARALFHLPYYDARMSSERIGDTVHYTSRRTHRGVPSAVFSGRYRAVGSVYQARQGTLDHWLTERYCLYAADRWGHVYRSDIHHQPWPLQTAEVDVAVNTMTLQLSLDLPKEKPLLHFARRLDVVAWMLERAGISTTARVEGAEAH